MKRIWIWILLLLLIGCGFLWSSMEKGQKEKVGHDVTYKDTEIAHKPAVKKRMLSSTYTGEIFQWMGESVEKLESQLGKPVRKDLSAYDYTWWVYTDHKKSYIQFGVQNGKIMTIYVIGDGVESSPIEIGQTYDEMNKQLPFEQSVTFQKGISSYEFQLSDEDIQMRPLLKMTDDIFIQCYFDTETNRLSSIRVVNGETLVKHKAYEMQYRGKLLVAEKLSGKQWSKVEAGMEQQIFDITNVMRQSFKKSQLKWDESVKEVAYLHSKDMAENHYFSHESQNGDGLKERLAANEVFYFSAGENIAAQYVDAPAAMEGWLNSKGHREALLNDSYTHLGVGAYQLYYTQNFLSKP